MKKLLIFLFVLTTHLTFWVNAQQAVVGQPLPAWKEGYLDLHHINTGRGSSAYYIFPDGTTMLLDAGEINPHGRTGPFAPKFGHTS